MRRRPTYPFLGRNQEITLTATMSNINMIGISHATSGILPISHPTLRDKTRGGSVLIRWEGGIYGLLVVVLPDAIVF